MRAEEPSLLVAVLALIALSLLSGCGGNNAQQATSGSPFRVPSQSMEPTYKQGQTVRIAVNSARKVQVGDVIVFFTPAGVTANRCGAVKVPGQMCRRPTRKRLRLMFLKRVVAKGGDLVSMRNGHTLIDGKMQDEPYIRPCVGNCDYPRPVRVPRGYLFLLGDNRGASDDSRYWGPIPKAWVVGRVLEKE
jgi:signal peptidase I